MKKIKNVLIMSISFLMLLTNAQSQTTITPTPPINTEIRKPVEPIPYSAEAVSETIQTLSNGNKIRRVSKETIYADGKGRVRRETENNFGNRISKMINIRDPLAGFDYYLVPTTKIAYRIALKPLSSSSQRVSAPMGYSTKSERLGTKTIQGFEAQGSTSVTTIAAGTIGNEQALETTSESWYSPELRTIILTNRKDILSGDYTYEMKNIKREMPDASLFVVPADYKIVEQESLNDRYFTVDTPK